MTVYIYHKGLSTAATATAVTITGEPRDFGASAPALRVAALLGNAGGAAAFGAGTTSAQTLRVVLPTDQTAIPSSQSGAWNINDITGTVSLPTGAATSANQATANGLLTTIDADTGNIATSTASIDTKSVQEALDFGIASGALRVAALLGNAAGVADFNSGAAGAQTLRTVLATRHETSTTPLAVRLSDGSGFYSNANKTYVAKFRNDYSSVNVTTGAFVSLGTVPSPVTEIEIFDSSGQTLMIGVDPAGGTAFSERMYVFPGGNGRIPLLIASSSSIGVKAVSATANAGEIDINVYG